MFKKIFRPPSSTSKKVDQGEQGSPLSADIEQVPPEQKPLSTDMAASSEKEPPQPHNLSQFSSVEAFDISIEDFDPYSEPQKMRRSKSFSYQPASKEELGFKLPRSKSVHFAELARPSTVRGPSADEASLKYSSSVDEDKGKPAIPQTLLGILLTGASKLIFNKKSTVVDLETEGEKDAEGSFEKVVSKKCPTSPVIVDEVALQKIGTQSDKIPENKDHDHSEDVYNKLSTVYLKYFSSLKLDAVDLDGLVASIDSGIENAVQETRFCKDLLRAAEHKAKDAEEEATGWRNLFEERDKQLEDLDKRSKEDFANLKRLHEEKVREVTTQNSLVDDLTHQLKAIDKDSADNIKDLNNRIHVLANDRDSYEAKMRKMTQERDALKRELEEIEGKLRENMKMKNLEISRLRSSNEALKSGKELADISSKVTHELELQLQECTNTIERLEVSNEELNRAVDIKNFRIEELLASRGKLEDLVSVQEEKLKNSMCEMARFGDLLENCQDDALQMRSKNERLQSEKEDMLRTMESLDSRISENSKELLLARVQGEDASKQLQSVTLKANDKYAEYRNEVERLTGENKKLEDELTKKISLNHDLNADIKRRKKHFTVCLDCLKKVSWSNDFAVEALRKLLKNTYETLAPAFPHGSISEFAQNYYEVFRINSFTPRNLLVIANLSTSIVEVMRQVVSTHIDVRQALEEERLIRKGYQKDALSVISKITKYYTTQGDVSLVSRAKSTAKLVPKSIDQTFCLEDIIRSKKAKEGTGDLSR